MKKRFMITIVFSLFAFSLFGQEEYQLSDWINSAKTKSLDEVVVEAEAYFDKVGRGRRTGYKQFMRWWHLANVNKNATGNAQNMRLPAAEFNTRMSKTRATSTLMNFNSWQAIGPFTDIGTEKVNIGRLMSISVGGDENEILLTASDGGGLWKSINGGLEWVNISSTLPTLDLSYAIMANSDSSIIYVLEGTPIVGNYRRLFKSIDGGNNFKTVNSGNIISGKKILTHRTDPNKIWICASGALWYSNNGGILLTKLVNNVYEDFYDIAIHPTDNNIIYASSDKTFYISTDAGISFTAHLSKKFVNVTRIATLQSQPDSVWIAEKNSSSDKIHKSKDKGITFAEPTAEGNRVGYWPTRNMAFAIHPNFPNIYYMGGIDFFRSTGVINEDTGSNWKFVPKVHADIQEIKFVDNTLYVVSDGGISKIVDHNTTVFPTTVGFTSLNNNLPIKQIWRMSVSKTAEERVIFGSQDNGSAWLKNGVWEHASDGDGGDCAINPKNPDIYYSSICVNKGVHSNAKGYIYPIVDETKTQYIFPVEIDEQNPETVYYASMQLYRQNTPQSEWEQVGNFKWNEGYYTSIDFVKVAPSNSNKIYLINNVADMSFFRSTLIYKTDDKGLTWNKIKIPENIIEIKDFATHPKKENQIAFITLDNNIFESNDAGISWNNITKGINSTIYALAYDGSDNNGKYVTGIGKVYYSNENVNSPLDLSGDLPLVQITDVEINPELKKVYLATYGRGIYRTELYSETVDSSNIDAVFEIAKSQEIQTILVKTGNYSNNLLFEPKIKTNLIGENGARIENLTIKSPAIISRLELKNIISDVAGIEIYRCSVIDGTLTNPENIIAKSTLFWKTINAEKIINKENCASEKFAGKIGEIDEKGNIKLDVDNDLKFGPKLDVNNKLKSGSILINRGK